MCFEGNSYLCKKQCSLKKRLALRERMKIEQKGLEKCSKYEQVKRKKGSANKKTGKCDNLCFCS